MKTPIFNIFFQGERIRTTFRNNAFVDRWVSALELRKFRRTIAPRRKAFAPDPKFAAQYAEEIAKLRRDGVLFLPGRYNFNPAQLANLAQLMQEKGSNWDLVDTLYPAEAPAELAAFAQDRALDQLIEHCKGYCAMDKVFRLYKSSHLDEVSGSFLWHHDGLFDYYKVIVYLSEVTIAHGPFAYVLGSHAIDHKYYSYQRSRYAEEKLPADKIRYYEGKPGDVLILNANGIHRACNPQPGNERLVASVAYIEFLSNQSTDHLYSAKQLNLNPST